MVKNSLSFRHALKNHIKKTVRAIKTDTKNAGPNQGYFVSPHSCALPSSALIYQPLSQRFTAYYGRSYTRKGDAPLRIQHYPLQDKVIRDQANKYNVHHHSGKNKAVSKILFFQVFFHFDHAAFIWRTCGCRPASRLPRSQTGWLPKAASTATC